MSSNITLSKGLSQYASTGGGGGGSGSSFIQAFGAPSGATGVDGDSYFDKAGRGMYGPKAGGAWASPAILRQWYPVIAGETGVLDEVYPPGHNRRYGIIPDGVTNWESSFPSRVAAWFNSWHLVGARGYAEPGFYRTALNIVGTGMNGSYCYMDYAEFAGVFHVFSSATPTPGETKIEDLAFPGTMILYDRLGPVNVKNITFGDVLLKDDPAKNLNGDRNRGAHIYFGVDGLTVNDMVVFDTGNAPNMESALAMDGANDNPKNCRFNRYWCKDTAVHAAYITGGGHYFGEIRVDSFGRTAYVGAGLQDSAGLGQSQELCGVWLNRTWDSTFNRILVGQVAAASTAPAVRPNAVYDVRVSETDISGPRGIAIGSITCSNLGAGGSTGAAATSTGRGVCFGDRNYAGGARAVNLTVGNVDLQMRAGVTLQTGYQALQVNAMAQPSQTAQTGDTRLLNLGDNTGLFTQAGTTYGTSGRTSYVFSGALFSRGTAADISGYVDMPRGVYYRFRGGSLDVPAIDWKAAAGSRIGACDLDASSSGATTKKAVNINGANFTQVGPIASRQIRSTAGAIAVNATTNLSLEITQLSSTIAAGMIGVRLTGTLTDVAIRGGAITGFDTGIAKGAATLTRLTMHNIVSPGGGAPNNTTGTNLAGADYTIIGAINLA